MNEQQFRAELEASGYQCTQFDIEPNRQRNDHSHPWHARLLVLEGELTLATAEGERTFGPGESCALDANTMRSELTGLAGARGLVGKKEA